MSDWSPLAASNPVPGEPEAIARFAASLRVTADTLRTQSERLRAVDSRMFWDGVAAASFDRHRAHLPSRLDAVATRYASVSRALDGYYPGLADAQCMARRALADAQLATSDIGIARRGIAQMEATAVSSSAPWTGPDYQALLARAEAELDAARALLRRAERLRDDRAHVCAGAIGAAVHDALDDGGIWGAFKRFAGHVSDALPALSHALGTAGAVIGVLSIALPVLTPIAVGLTAASLVVDTVLAAQGRGSWVRAGTDALALVSFGAGRLLQFGRAAPVAEAVEAGTPASSIVSARGLTRQLLNEEASAIFTETGELKPEVIRQSRPFMEGGELKNPELIKHLTADGTDVGEWAKYTTPSYQSPSGRFQVHFYYNKTQDLLDYTFDFKAKFNNGVLPR